MQFERSFGVDTTVQRAYKMISDPTNIPKYVPDIENVLVTRITPGLVGTQMTMRTREHTELSGEVIEADNGRGCAFKTSAGRVIRWRLDADGGAVKLTSTVDTDESLDEARLVPEMERSLRTLRNTLRSNRR